VQQVGIHGIGGLFLGIGIVHRDIVALAVGHQGLPGGKVPQRVGAKLEAYLVIALAGGAMGDGIRTGLVGNLDQALGDQWTGNGSTQQVLPLIHGVGAEHGEHEVAHELLAQVVDVDLLDTHGLGLGTGGLHLFSLADIGSEGHHLAVIGVLQPAGDHRGIQSSGIGQDDLAYI
jgi:hypothetical protein